MRKDSFYKWVYAISAVLFLLALQAGRLLLSGAWGTGAEKMADHIGQFYSERSPAYREAYAMFKLSREEALRALYEQALLNDYILSHDAEP